MGRASYAATPPPGTFLLSAGHGIAFLGSLDLGNGRVDAVGAVATYRRRGDYGN